MELDSSLGMNFNFCSVLDSDSLLESGSVRSSCSTFISKVELSEDSVIGLTSGTDFSRLSGSGFDSRTDFLSNSCSKFGWETWRFSSFELPKGEENHIKENFI